jgi:hypothetical protein
MKIGNLGNQRNQKINGDISNHVNLGSHVNGGRGMPRICGLLQPEKHLKIKEINGL